MKLTDLIGAIDGEDFDVKSELLLEDGEGRTFDITGLQYGMSFGDSGYTLTLVIRER
jgi:hypothetical protein